MAAWTAHSWASGVTFCSSSIKWEQDGLLGGWKVPAERVWKVLVRWGPPCKRREQTGGPAHRTLGSKSFGAAGKRSGPRLASPKGVESCLDPPPAGPGGGRGGGVSSDLESPCFGHPRGPRRGPWTPCPVLSLRAPPEFQPPAAMRSFCPRRPVLLRTWFSLNLSLLSNLKEKTWTYPHEWEPGMAWT